MSDQKNASHRRGRSGRPVNRTLGAAVAAGGLALSALLYPLPGDSQLLKLFPPNHKSPDLPKALDFSAVDLQNLDQMVPDLLSIDSHGLARLVDLGQKLDLPTPVLLGLAQTYGVANVVMLLDSLAQTIATASGGGGGGGGGSAGSPVASPILLTLLDVLRQNSPGRLVNGWSEFVGAVVPQVLRRMGIPAAAAAVQQPEAKLATVAGTAAPAPNQEPAPIPSPEPQPVSVQQSGPALRPEPAPVATEESVPQPTQEPKPLTNQLQAAVSSETPTPPTSVANNILGSTQSTIDAQPSDTGLVRNSLNASEGISSAGSGSTASGGLSTGDNTPAGAPSPGSGDTTSGDATSGNGSASGGG